MPAIWKPLKLQVDRGGQSLFEVGLYCCDVDLKCVTGRRNVDAGGVRGVVGCDGNAGAGCEEFDCGSNSLRRRIHVVGLVTLRGVVGWLRFESRLSNYC